MNICISQIFCKFHILEIHMMIYQLPYYILPYNYVQVTILLALSATHLLTDMQFSWNAVLPKLEDTSKFIVTKEDVAWLGDYKMTNLYRLKEMGPF